MSYNTAVINALNAEVDRFIDAVAARKSAMSRDALRELWYGAQSAPQARDQAEAVSAPSLVAAPAKEARKKSTLDPQNPLSKLSKKELSDMCKAKNLPYSGTKADMISLLNGGVKESKVLATMLPRAKPHSVKKRKDGLGEDADGRVFDGEVVVGQRQDDKVVELSKETVVKCKNQKLKFKMPSNLNSSIVIRTDNDDADSVDKADVFDAKDEAPDNEQGDRGGECAENAEDGFGSDGFNTDMDEVDDFGTDMDEADDFGADEM